MDLYLIVLFFTYAGNFGGLAYARCREHFTNFPGKDRRFFSFALDDGGDDARRQQPRSASTDGPRLQEPSAAVAVQDLADAAVGNLRGAVILLAHRFKCNYLFYGNVLGFSCHKF